MRERTPSADDTPKRAPPAPPREAASAEVTGSKASNGTVATKTTSSTPATDERMVASTHSLDDLGTSQAIGDRQQEKHAYRSAPTAQDKRSRLSNVINNLRKKVPDTRTDSSRKEEDDRNSVERNLETLEKYVMTVLNGVIKDEEDGEIRKDAERENAKECEKMEQDDDSKGPVAKFEPSKPNESRTEAAVLDHSEKEVLEDPVRIEELSTSERSEESSESQDTQEKMESRSLGTIIMERLTEHQDDRSDSKDDEFPGNAELRNICRDLLNDLLNDINQLIDEESRGESCDESRKSQELTSLHCSLPLDKVASVLQNCQGDPGPQSPGSSQPKSPKPASPTVPIRHLCLYCDRKFVSISLRQRHTERVHQLGGGRRSERNSRKPLQNCQYCSDKCAESLEGLFQHMVCSHADKYHACVQCSTRYVTKEALAGHISESHSQERSVESPCKECPREKDGPKERKVEKSEGERSDAILLKPSVMKDISNPGSPEFDSSFYSSVSCNIRENLLHHLDGKLTSTPVESKPQQSFYEHNVNQIQFPIDISLTAATPVYTKGYTAEGYENSSEYAQKPGKSRTHPRRVSFEKYNFPRKYDGKEQWTCSIKDLSKFDISTQLSLRKKQQLLKERVTINRLHHIPILGPAGTTDLGQSGVEQKLESPEPDGSGSIEEASAVRNNGEAAVVVNQTRCNSEKLTGVECKLDDCQTSTLIQLKSTEFSAEFGNFLRLRKWDENLKNETGKTEKVVYAELTGEWSRPRIYICGACASKYITLREMEDHKATTHPNVWCSHFEFSGDQRELYKHLFLPGRSLATAKARCAILPEKVCTKCSKNCTSLPELHRHMLECGGDQAWLLGLFGNGKKKCKWRPFGSRSRRRRQRGMKRNIQNSQTPRVNVPKEKQPTGPRVRPSDRESIQKMLANLPPKRVTRKVLQDSSLRAQGRLRNVQTRSRPRIVGDNSSASRLSRNKAALRNKLLKNAKSIQRNRCRSDNISAIIESVVKNCNVADRKLDVERNPEKTLDKDAKEKTDAGPSEADGGRTRIARGPRVLSKKRNVKTKLLIKSADQTKPRERLTSFKSRTKPGKTELKIDPEAKSKNLKTQPKVDKEENADSKSTTATKNKSPTQVTPKKKRPVDPVASLNASIKAKSQLRTQDGKFARNPNKESSPRSKSPRGFSVIQLIHKFHRSVTRSKLRESRAKDDEPKRKTRLSSDSDKMPTLEPAVQPDDYVDTSANDLPILSPIALSTVKKAKDERKEEGQDERGKRRTRNLEKDEDPDTEKRVKERGRGRKSAPVEEKRPGKVERVKDDARTRSSSRAKGQFDPDEAIKIQSVPFEVKKLIGSDSKEDLMTKLGLSRNSSLKRSLRQSAPRTKSAKGLKDLDTESAGSVSDSKLNPARKEKVDLRRKSPRNSEKKPGEKEKGPAKEEKSEEATKSREEFKPAAKNGSTRPEKESQSKSDRQTRGSSGASDEAQEVNDLKKNTSLGKRRGRIKSGEAEKKSSNEIIETDEESKTATKEVLEKSDEEKGEDESLKKESKNCNGNSDPEVVNANLTQVQLETSNSVDSGKENTLETVVAVQKPRVGRPKKTWRREKSKRSLSNVIGILTEGVNIPADVQNVVLAVQTTLENPEVFPEAENPARSSESDIGDLAPSVEEGHQVESSESKERTTRAKEPANDIILDLSRRKPRGKGSFLEKIVSKIAKQKDALLEGEVGSLLDTAADELTSILDEVPTLCEGAENPEGKACKTRKEKVKTEGKVAGEVKSSTHESSKESFPEGQTEGDILEAVVEKDPTDAGGNLENVLENCKEKERQNTSGDGKTAVSAEKKNCDALSVQNEADSSKADQFSQPEINSTSPSETISKSPPEMNSNFPPEINCNTRPEINSKSPQIDVEKTAEVEEESADAKPKRKSKKRSLEGTSPKKNKRPSVEAVDEPEENLIPEELRLADIMKLIDKSRQNADFYQETEEIVLPGKRKPDDSEIDSARPKNVDADCAKKLKTDRQDESDEKKDSEKSEVLKSGKGNVSGNSEPVEAEAQRRSPKRNILPEESNDLEKKDNSKTSSTAEPSPDGARRRSSRTKSDLSFSINDILETSRKENERSSNRTPLEKTEDIPALQTTILRIPEVPRMFERDPELDKSTGKVPGKADASKDSDDLIVVPKVPKKRGRKKKSLMEEHLLLPDEIPSENSSKEAENLAISTRKSARSRNETPKTPTESSNNSVSSLEHFKIPEVTEVLQHTKKRGPKRKPINEDHLEAQTQRPLTSPQSEVNADSSDGAKTPFEGDEQSEDEKRREDSSESLNASRKSRDENERPERSSSSGSIDLQSRTRSSKRRQLSSEDLSESVDELSETSCASESSYFRKKRFSKKKKDPLDEGRSDRVTDSESVDLEKNERRQSLTRRAKKNISFIEDTFDLVDDFDIQDIPDVQSVCEKVSEEPKESEAAVEAKTDAAISKASEAEEKCSEKTKGLEEKESVALDKSEQNDPDAQVSEDVQQVPEDVQTSKKRGGNFVVVHKKTGEILIVEKRRLTKEAARFFCAVCATSFTRKSSLKKHNISQSHLVQLMKFDKDKDSSDYDSSLLENVKDMCDSWKDTIDKNDKNSVTDSKVEKSRTLQDEEDLSDLQPPESCSRFSVSLEAPLAEPQIRQDVLEDELLDEEICKITENMSHDEYVLTDHVSPVPEASSTPVKEVKKEEAKKKKGEKKREKKKKNLADEHLELDSPEPQKPVSDAGFFLDVSKLIGEDTLADGSLKDVENSVEASSDANGFQKRSSQPISSEAPQDFQVGSAELKEEVERDQVKVGDVSEDAPKNRNEENQNQKRISLKLTLSKRTLEQHGAFDNVDPGKTFLKNQKKHLEDAEQDLSSLKLTAKIQELEKSLKENNLEDYDSPGNVENQKPVAVVNELEVETGKIDKSSRKSKQEHSKKKNKVKKRLRAEHAEVNDGREGFFNSPEKKPEDFPTNYTLNESNDEEKGFVTVEKSSERSKATEDSVKCQSESLKFDVEIAQKYLQSFSESKTAEEVSQKSESVIKLSNIVDEPQKTDNELNANLEEDDLAAENLKTDDTATKLDLDSDTNPSDAKLIDNSALLPQEKSLSEEAKQVDEVPNSRAKSDCETTEETSKNVQEKMNSHRKTDRQSLSKKSPKTHKKEGHKKSKGGKVKAKVSSRTKIALSSESDDSEGEDKIESQNKSKIVKSVFGRVFGGEKTDKVKEVLNDWVSKSDDDSDVSRTGFHSTSEKPSFPARSTADSKIEERGKKRHSSSVPSGTKKRSARKPKKNPSEPKEKSTDYKEDLNVATRNSSGRKREEASDHFISSTELNQLVLPSSRCRQSKKRAEERISKAFEEYLDLTSKPAKRKEASYELRNQSKSDNIKEDDYEPYNFDEAPSKDVDDDEGQVVELKGEEQRSDKKRRSSGSRKSKSRSEEDWGSKDDLEEVGAAPNTQDNLRNELPVDLESNSSRNCSSLAPSSVRNRSPSLDRNSQTTRDSDVEEDRQNEAERRLSPLFICGTPNSSIESSSNEDEDEEEPAKEEAVRKRSSSEFSGEKLIIRSPSSTKGEVVTITPTDAIEDNALDVPQEIETKPRQGKVLNFDEELFVECCSRLKATTENELRGAKKIKLDHIEGYHKEDQQQMFRNSRDRWRDVESQNSLGSLLESVNQLLGEEMYSTRERDYPKRGGRNLRSKHSSRSGSPDISRADNPGYEDSLDVAFEHNNKLRDKIQQRMRESESLIASTFSQKTTNDFTDQELIKDDRDILRNYELQDPGQLAGSNLSNRGYESLIRNPQEGGKIHLDAGFKTKMNSALGGLLDKALSNLLHSNGKHDQNGSTPMKVLAELACARAPTSTSGDSVPQEATPPKSFPKDSMQDPNLSLPKEPQIKKARNPIKELFERKKEMNERKQQEKLKADAMRDLNKQRKTKKTKKHHDFPLIRRDEHGGLAERKKRRDRPERKEESDRIKDVYDFDEEESQIDSPFAMPYRSKADKGYEVSCLRTKEVDVADLMTKAIGETLENGKAADTLGTRLESMIDRKFKELEKFAPRTKGALKAFQSEEQRVTGPMDEFVERKRVKRSIEQLKHSRLKKRSRNPRKKARNAWYENDSSDEYRTAVKAEKVGVGITKSQRACSKGKQNLFAELSTSSESEFDEDDADFEAKRERRANNVSEGVDNCAEGQKLCLEENEVDEWDEQELKDSLKDESDNKKSESEMSDQPLVIDERKDMDEQRNSDEEVDTQYERNFELDDLYREDSSVADSDAEEPIIEREIPNDLKPESPGVPEDKGLDERSNYAQEDELIPLEEALDLLDQDTLSMKYENKDSGKADVEPATPAMENKVFDLVEESERSPDQEEVDDDLPALPEKLSSNEKPQKESENLPLHVFLSRKVQESKKRKEQQLKKMQEEQERILLDFQPTRRQRKCAIGKQGLLAEFSSSDEEACVKESRRTSEKDYEKLRRPKRESKEKRKERYIEKKHEQMIAKEQKAIEEEILRELGKKKDNPADKTNLDAPREQESTEATENKTLQPTPKKKHSKERKKPEDDVRSDPLSDLDCDKSLQDDSSEAGQDDAKTPKLKKHLKSPQKSKKINRPEPKTPTGNRKSRGPNADRSRNRTESKGSKESKERRSSSGKRDSDDEELKTTKSWNKVEEGVGVAIGRRKRAAANQLYYWSSSSDEEEVPEVAPAAEEEDDRQEQHGWIVGDSHKRMITMLAMEKQLKEKRRRSEDEFEPGKAKSKKHRNSTS